MKKNLTIIILCILSVSAFSQNEQAFKGHIYCDEYQIWIDMNFYDADVLIPEQEIFGEVAGYIGAVRDPRKWIIISAVLTDEKTAKLEIINDYGSEDLKATLTKQQDGSYVLRQESGNTLKIVVNRKWLKLPKTVSFKVSETPSKTR